MARRVRSLDVRVADTKEKLRELETKKKIIELKRSLGVQRRSFKR